MSARVALPSSLYRDGVTTPEMNRRDYYSYAFGLKPPPHDSDFPANCRER